MRKAGLSLTLKDLRIAKVTKKTRVNPCTKELEAYINALADYGEERMPAQITKALNDCTNRQVSFL
jgi:hypothetical protein